MQTLEDTGEFGFIERLAQFLPTASFLLEGVGDDCAVVRCSDRLLLVSSDMFLENVHFRRSYFSPEDIGWKAAVRALSDIAAMGGAPLFCVTSVACPSSTRVRFLEDLYRGMVDALNRFGAVIVGGDTAHSPDALFVDLAMVGEAVGGRCLRRKGALPGDLLCVTGPLGTAAAGLHALENGREAPPEVLRAHLHPVPRIQCGQWLCACSDVHAMLDISDGLFQDAGHLGEPAGLGVDLFSRHIPFQESFVAYCEKEALSPLELALTGGEDYELACAVAANVSEEVCRAFRQTFQKDLYVVGRFVEDWEGVRIDSKPVTFTGYQHFVNR
ncbi:MAG TPA: thiamine-phosphate kinase [Candidatus Hydrogenedentes bacterium]|nr:thiamine-phosphate kinase [Candidatus Hydrogenedentota bacterium]HOL78019.1 thiamine-phosphate kinase [Candidatus Hydrogenedentota bacterium]